MVLMIQSQHELRKKTLFQISPPHIRNGTETKFLTINSNGVIIDTQQQTIESVAKQFFKIQNSYIPVKFRALYVNTLLAGGQCLCNYWELSVKLGQCNFTSVFSYRWSHRLSVRTQGFHPWKRGSIPRGSSKIWRCRKIGNPSGL